MDIEAVFGTRTTKHTVKQNEPNMPSELERRLVSFAMSSDQSVPKYLCPKCVGATGWTSVVKMVMSGNSWIIDLAPV